MSRRIETANSSKLYAQIFARFYPLLKKLRPPLEASARWELEKYRIGTTDPVASLPPLRAPLQRASVLVSF